MNFINRKEGEVTVAVARGRLDSSGAPATEQHFSQLLAAGEKRIVVDCTGLEYVSSAGLRVFLSTAKQIQNVQGAFVLACLNKEVKDIFEIAGFTAIIPIHAELADAISACASA